MDQSETLLMTLQINRSQENEEASSMREIIRACFLEFTTRFWATLLKPPIDIAHSLKPWLISALNTWTQSLNYIYAVFFYTLFSTLSLTDINIDVICI